VRGGENISLVDKLAWYFLCIIDLSDIDPLNTFDSEYGSETCGRNVREHDQGKTVLIIVPCATPLQPLVFKLFMIYFEHSHAGADDGRTHGAVTLA
jgi:hypothetical protein